MGHLTVKSYNTLYKRMDQDVSAPYNSKEFYEILKILFTDEEAVLCSVMPLLPASLEKISRIWETPDKETFSILKILVGKGLVYETEYNDAKLYTLAVPVFGFFEFSLMRNDGKFNRKLLSELYTNYINKNDGFITKYCGNKPNISRTLVHEETLTKEATSEILSYEKSSHIIDSADVISVGTCFCRHKKEHAGEACDNPQDVCMSFGGIAKSLIDEGIAREINKTEAVKILDLCVKKGLVQIGDNVKNQPVVICNCCGCCCDLLNAYKKTGMSTIVSPSSYVAKIDNTMCNDCGLCEKRCPIDAISKNNGKFAVNSSWCLGCGVCSTFCKTKACMLISRPEKVFIPDDTIHKVVLAAIYQAKVGNFLFDNQKKITHKILRNVINLIVKFQFIKWILFKKTIQNKIIRIALEKNNIADIKI
jgi:Pyruvate/2-oxoacid:ferredoxin oxidoreductase delta subunit